MAFMLFLSMVILGVISVNNASSKYITLDGGDLYGTEEPGDVTTG